MPTEKKPMSLMDNPKQFSEVWAPTSGIGLKWCGPDGPEETPELAIRTAVVLTIFDVAGEEIRGHPLGLSFHNKPLMLALEQHPIPQRVAWVDSGGLTA